jgi:hypothetical protein
MPLNVQPPKASWNDIKEFIFASLILAVTFGAGVMIYQNGDAMALTPVTPNTATVINAY